MYNFPDGIKTLFTLLSEPSMPAVLILLTWFITILILAIAVLAALL